MTLENANVPPMKRGRIIIASLGLVAVATACSENSSQQVAGDLDAAEASGDDSGTIAQDAGPSSHDSGSRGGSKVDAEPGDAASMDSDGDHTAPDAESAFDGSLLDATTTCVPVAAPVACANGFASTFTSQSLPHLIGGGGARVRYDRGGKLHASWSNTVVGVTYLSNSTGSFVVEQVAQPMGLPNESFDFARLAVDACGNPTILYREEHQMGTGNQTGANVYLATRQNGVWSSEQVIVPTSASDGTPATDVGVVDLVLDTAGSPVVLALRKGDSHPMVMRRSGVTWSTESVPIVTYGINLPQATWSSTLGLVFATEDLQTFSHGVSLVWKQGGTWTKYDLPGADPLDAFGRDDEPGLALNSDASGRVHLAWRSYLASGGRVMHYTTIASPSAWTPIVAVPLPFDSMPISMTLLLSSASEPMITYDQFDGSNEHSYISRMVGGSFAASARVALYVENSASVVDATGRESVLVVNGNGPAMLYTRACAP